MILFWNFVIFWGVWLLVPLLVDGMTTLISLVTVLATRRKKILTRELRHYPQVSIVLPVYNSQETLEACLRSIAAQDYPMDCIEIFAVNNGSKDRSLEVFENLRADLDLNLQWISVVNQGKAWALNAGIHLVRGDYIFNVDSDVILSPLAVRNVVLAFESQPNLGALTGAIHVLPAPAGASVEQVFLGQCEFLEYITAYHVGRMHQAFLGNLYTLSGAFSVFRREVILRTHLYDQKTVTEDTDMTFHLYQHFPKWKIGVETSAIAYVYPIESLRALYAQRVRWQRGQVEVSARYNSLMSRPMWSLSGFTPSRVLLIDHTLSFTRLVWTLFMPILILFDYPLSFLIMAFGVIYLFYLLVDVLWLFVAWLDADEKARERLVAGMGMIFIMPVYRMLVFWFRMSGFLHAVAEPGSWRVKDPVAQTRAGGQEILGRMKLLFKRKH
jgi:putative glycosyltransferase (exosortase G-associated)